MWLNKNSCWVGFDKNGVKTPVCFSEPSAYCCDSHFPYESELSTESLPHISSGAHATQKNKLAINRDKPLGLAKCALRIHKILNRIKTVGTYKVRIGNTCGCKQNKDSLTRCYIYCLRICP